MSNFRTSIIFIFLKNLYALFRCDIYKEIKEANAAFELKRTNEVLEARQKILGYFILHPQEIDKYRYELDFVIKNKEIVFPYKQLKYLDNVNIELDTKRGMYYVLHNSNKLYFPKNKGRKKVEELYRNLIENENLLGGGYRSMSPHQYESKKIKVENGDVLLDIGCAEALFALHHIEILKHVYLIESDILWMDALQATFEPYKEKVTIINKLVDTIDSQNSISLSSILTKISIKDVLFLKMDIEGAEYSTLKYSKDSLMQRKIKIACCTYHKLEDYENIHRLLQDMQFHLEDSEGYMLVHFFNNFDEPYFRHGLIRGYNF